MTSAGTPGNYVDFDEYVGLKLEKTRSTIRTTDVLTALAGVASAFLGYLLLFVIFDQWVLSSGFSVLWRWILLSLLVIATAAWLTWKIGIPSLKTVNGLFAAQEIEKAEPSLKSNLLNLVDLKAAGRPINPSVLKALERQTAVRLQKVDVGQSIDHRPLIRTAYVLLAIIVVFCFYALLSPKKISNSIWRGLFPASRVSVATVTEIIEVKPGDLTIPVHQQSVEIQVDVAGEVPEHVTLLYSTSDGKIDQPIELHVEQAGEMRYRGQLIGEGTQGLIHDITYYIRAGDATSRSYKITVEQPPYADIETVRIEHPAYMKIPPIEQSNNPAIEAWEGAKVILTAKSNMPVSSAKIQFLDEPQTGPNGEEVPMSIGGAGLQLQATWPLGLRSDGTQSKLYRIHCRTSDDRVTTGHVNYPINVKPDLPPEVVLIYPDRDIDVASNATVPLAIQARDPDFELGYVYLNVEKSGQKIFREQISEGRQPKLALKSDLPMTRLNPAVGDTFEIWIEAFDNKQPRPNSRNTPKIRIHVIPPVSPKDADRQLAEQKDQNDQKLAQSESELNPDRTEPAQQPDDENKQRDNPNEVAAKDVDRSQKANPQDQNPNDENPQNGEQAKGGQGKSGSAKANEKGPQQNPANKSADQRQNGGSESERDAGGQNGPSGKEAQQNKPLKSDGSQDDEAIQRINQTMKEKNAAKPKDRNDSSPSDEQEPSKDNDNKTKGKDSKSESANQEQKQLDSENPSAKNGKKNDKTDPSSDPKQSKNPDQQDQKSNGQGDEGETSPSKEGSSESKSDGKSDKPKDRNQQGQKDSNQKPDADSPNQQPGQDSNSDEPKNDGDAKIDPSKESKQNSDGKNSEATKDGKKAGDKSESGNKSKSPSQKGGELKDTESGGDDKAPSQSNEKSSKPDSADKGDGKQPKNGSSDAESAPNGDKQPTSDSGNSQKQKADGTEKGVAKPDRDPNSNPETVDNENVKRDPKEKPEIRPGSDPSEPNADRSAEPAEGNGDQGDKQKAVPKKGEQGDKRSPQDKNDANSDDPESKDAGRPMPDPNAAGKEDADSKEPKAGDKPDNAKDSGKPDSKSAKPKGQPPKGEKSKSDAVKNSKSDGSDPKNSKSQEANDSGDEPGDKGESAAESGKSKPDAKGDQKGGKKSEKPDAENQVAEQAGKKPDSDKPDRGKSEQSEDQGGEKGGKENGKDDAKGDGEAKGKEAGKGQSESKGKGSKPGKGNQPGDAKGESGKSDKSGDKGDSGKPGGKSAKPGDGKPDGASGSGGSSGNSGTGDGHDQEIGTGEDANLEYNRQATELILDKLKNDLDRGEVDSELLEQLGWTETQLKQFADRISKSLKDSNRTDETPESKARQIQFQEMLKSLDLQKSGSQRSGEKEPKRDVQQIESKRTPPPPAIGSAFKKYTRDQARQKSTPSSK